MNQNLFPLQCLHPSIPFQISNTSYMRKLTLSQVVCICLQLWHQCSMVTFRLQSFQIGGKLYEIILTLFPWFRVWEQIHFRIIVYFSFPWPSKDPHFLNSLKFWQITCFGLSPWSHTPIYWSMITKLSLNISISGVQTNAKEICANFLESHLQFHWRQKHCPQPTNAIAWRWLPFDCKLVFITLHFSHCIALHCIGYGFRCLDLQHKLKAKWMGRYH